MSPQSHLTTLPRCYACGYELTGLTVEGHCPECNAKIWASQGPAPTSGLAVASLVLGCLSIVTCASVGPFALLFGIPGIICGHLSLAHVRLGTHGGSSRGFAIAGLIMSWIGAVVGLLYLGFFALIFGSMFGAGGFMPPGAGGVAPVLPVTPTGP